MTNHIKIIPCTLLLHVTIWMPNHLDGSHNLSYLNWLPDNQLLQTTCMASELRGMCELLACRQKCRNEALRCIMQYGLCLCLARNLCPRTHSDYRTFAAAKPGNEVEVLKFQAKALADDQVAVDVRTLFAAPSSPICHQVHTICCCDRTAVFMRVQVTHCGICHSDLHTINDEWSSGTGGSHTHYPCVPGHVRSLFCWLY